MRKEKRRSSPESEWARIEARRAREAKLDAQRRDIEHREASYRAALAKKAPTADELIERLIGTMPGGSWTSSARELCRHLTEVAPRLLDSVYLRAILNLGTVDWIRPATSWEPRGKGKETLYRGLCEHLLARYRMPPFFWTAFFAEGHARPIRLFAARVAGGASAYDEVKGGLMPAPLTRKMCHDLMTTSGEISFLEAIRRVQVRAAGGDGRILKAWMGTAAGRALSTRPNEEFWAAVLGWFCANPMLPTTEIGPICDYIAHRRLEDPKFSMKGRSVLAMQRSMREWHGRLARERSVGAEKKIFKKSGFQPMDCDRSHRDKNGQHIRDIWHVREVLDGRTLADEGRAMGHCVLSYAGYIESGRSSIWTVTEEDDTGHWRRMTVEVQNASRQIVQARGRFNKMPEAKDMSVLELWAARNGLRVGVGQLW